MGGSVLPKSEVKQISEVSSAESEMESKGAVGRSAPCKGVNAACSQCFLGYYAPGKVSCEETYMKSDYRI